MSKDLRWRIIALQVVVTLIFAFGAGVAFWAHNFTQDQVRSQLTGQQITFPAANSPALTALPAMDANAMMQYAGQTMATGYQAHTYAEHFIKVHLSKMGGTYSYYSNKSIAEATTNPKQSAADEATALTLFRGETLRSLLNQAWAFWYIGDIAFYAGIGLTVGAVAAFLTFLFELFVAPKHLLGRPRTMAA